MENNHDLFTRTFSILLLVTLFVAMTAMFRYSVPLTITAWQDSSARTLAAEQATVTESLSYDDLVLREQQLRSEIPTLYERGYEVYFDFLVRANQLERDVRVAHELGGDYRTSSLFTTVRMTSMAGANAFMPAFNARSDVGEITRTPAFIAAHKRATDVHLRALPIAPAPPEFTLSAVGFQLLLSFIFCIPFAFGSVLVQIRRKTGESIPLILASFTSDWRLMLGVAVGPFSYFVTGALFLERDELVTNFRNLTYALGCVLSCFIGGGAMVVKAQAPDSGGKKKSNMSLSVVSRGEVDDKNGLMVTEIATVTDTDKNRFLEGIVTKSKASVGSYLLVGQEMFARKSETSAQSLSILGGVRTTTPTGGDTTVLAVVGARSRLSYKQLFWNTPLAAIEQPLNRSRKSTSVLLITRPGLWVTEKFGITGELVARATRGSKPRFTPGIYTITKAHRRITVESGLFITSSGAIGVRGQIGITLP